MHQFYLICFLCVFEVSSYYLPTYNFYKNISVPILNTSDLCKFMEIKNNILYRVGQSNVIQNWQIQNQSYSYQNMQYITYDGSQSIQNIDINMINSQITVPLSNTINMDMLNSLDLTQNGKARSSFTNFYLSKVQSTSTQYIFLYYSGTYNSVYVYNRNMMLKYTFTLGFTGKMNSIITNDELTLLIWQVDTGLVYIYKYLSQTLNNWTYYTIYTPTLSSSNMNRITLNDNGTIAIFQYDSASNLTIYNLTSLTVIKSLSFTNIIINQVLFMDSDCHLISVFVNNTIMQIYDIFNLTLLKTNIFPLISNYSSLDSTYETLYLCLQHDVQVYTITCPSLSYVSSTGQCALCVIPPMCIACNQNTGQCNSCQIGYILMNNTCIIGIQSNNQTTNMSLNSSTNNMTINQTNNSILSNSTNVSKIGQTVSSSAQTLINLTISGFTILNPVVTGLMFLFKVTPFSSIFLSFISYWNLCCLYSILNPNCPQYLFKVHQMIFDCIQTSIFELFGIRIFTPTLEDQPVEASYKVNYNLTLDFFQANLENLVVFCFSILTLYLFILAKDFIIGKKSILRKYLETNNCSIVVGQFISIVPYSIILFRYQIQDSSYQLFRIKLNHSLQLILFFFCILIPFIYLWSFQQQKDELIIQKNQIRNLYNYEKNMQSIRRLKQQKHQSKYQMREEFKMYLINVTVPILIILPTHIPFHLFNFGIFLYGFKNSFSAKKYKINCVINSLYWPLYHFCYVLFDLFSENQLALTYIGVFCICTMFLGGLHQLFNIFIISLIEFLIKLRAVMAQVKEKQINKILFQNQQMNLNRFTQKDNRIEKPLQKCNKVACLSQVCEIEKCETIELKKSFFIKNKYVNKNIPVFEIKKTKKQPLKVKFAQNFKHFPQNTIQNEQNANQHVLNDEYKNKKLPNNKVFDLEKRKVINKINESNNEQTKQQQTVQINTKQKKVSFLKTNKEQTKNDKKFLQQIRIKAKKSKKHALRIQYVEQ